MDVASTIGEDLDSFSLLIKNFPKSVHATEKLLEDFTKRLTWQENVEVKSAGPDSKFVIFTNVPTDAREVMEQIKEEAFCGVILDVCEVKQMKKLYLGNLRANVTELEICLYLEQPLFQSPCMEEFEVKVLHLDSKRRFAIVRIPDDADLNLYMTAQHTDMLGANVRISKYEIKKKEGAACKTKLPGRPQSGVSHSVNLSFPDVSHCSVEHEQCQSFKERVDPTCPPALRGLPCVQWLDVEEIDREKCQLMKKFVSDLKNHVAPGYRIWIDDRKHRIGVGHKDATRLQQFVDVVQARLKDMDSCSLSIPNELSQRLNCVKGFNFLIDFFNTRQLKAVYCFNRIKQQGMVTGENGNVARSAAEALQADIGSANVPVNWDRPKIPVEYFASSSWVDFRGKLLKDHIVIILINEDSNQAFPFRRIIVVKGFQVDLQVVRDKIKKQLESVQSNDGNSSAESAPKKNFPKAPTNNSKLPTTKNDPKKNVVEECGVKENKVQIEMAPLAYKFLKLHLPNIIMDKKVRYHLPKEFFELEGEEAEVIPKMETIKNILSTLVSKRAIIKFPGITEGYYNEKDSELRTELTRFEKEFSFAIDFKTVVTKGEKNTMLLYMHHKNNVKADSFTEMINELLQKFSKKKFLSLSDLLKQTGQSRATVTEELIKEINNICHKNVNVSIDDTLNTIVLHGREKVFKDVEKQIKDTISKFLSNHPDSTSQQRISMDSLMRMDNLPEFLKLFGHEDIFAPDHWTTYRGNLRGISSSAGKLVKLKPGSSAYKYILDMVTTTWNSTCARVKGDSSHRNVEVLNIFSVENVSQYKRYMAWIKEFCLQNSIPQFTSLFDECSATISNRGGSSHLLSEVNECHLFHGTRTKKMQGIINQGFDFRLGSQYAHFGQGIYFSENSTKADQYADSGDPKDGPGRTLYMFVARVLMGRMYQASQPTAFKRPPCISPSCSSDLCTIHRLHDSVLGNTLYNPLSSGVNASGESSDHCAQHQGPLMFREFVVYDRAQCFPEFLVEYKRV